MRIRLLTAADMPFALELCGQNRWNQLAADWQRQLDLEPAGCFLAEADGQSAGVACYCTFGAVAWINLVLVDRARRGQGIGAALLRHVVQALDERGIASIRLDATPLGQPVYARLGFTGEFTLVRFTGVLPAAGRVVADIEPLSLADLPYVFRLDEAVTGTRRENLLRHLFEADPARMRKFAPSARLEGFCLARPGANAWQIGPVQGSPQAGRRLLLDAAHQFAGQRVYLDVPIDNAAAVAVAQSLGLTEERRFLRMGRGRRCVEKLEVFWAAFGPEKG
jgi:GNAT superfamily N-acetyltransferase